MSYVFERNFDNDILVNYKDLLQYFEQFGYSQIQLFEAIRETNVGPHLNDFNVNRLLEYLSCQQDCLLEDSSPNESAGISDDDIISCLIKDVVNIAADQVDVLNQAKHTIRKQDIIDKEFVALVERVQTLGYPQHKVEKAIKETNANPNVGDASVGIVIDYLETVSQCTDENISEVCVGEPVFSADTSARNEVKLLVEELVAFIAHNADGDKNHVTMENFYHFIPSYWLPLESTLLVEDGIDNPDIYQGLIETVAKHNYHKKDIQSAIEATNVGPAVCEENQQCLLKYLQKHFQKDPFIRDVTMELLCAKNHAEQGDSNIEEKKIWLKTIFENAPKLKTETQECESGAKRDDMKPIINAFQPFIEYFIQCFEQQGMLSVNGKSFRHMEAVLQAATKLLNEMVTDVDTDNNLIDKICFGEAGDRVELYIELFDSGLAAYLEVLLMSLMKKYCVSMVLYLNRQRYGKMISDEFKPLVKWVKSQNPQMKWSTNKVKQAIFYTNVSPELCQETMTKIKTFLLVKKQKLDDELITAIEGKIQSLFENVTMGSHIKECINKEYFFQGIVQGTTDCRMQFLGSTAISACQVVLNMFPQLLGVVREYCFSPVTLEERTSLHFKSELPSVSEIAEHISEDIHHIPLIETIAENEKDLAMKLRSICDKRGQEKTPKESASIFHQLGKIYRQKSPLKIDLLRSAGLFNAAIIREPDNVDEIREDLQELCMHVLNLSGAKTQNASLVDASDTFLEEIKTMRDKAKNSLEHLQNIDGENKFYQIDMQLFKSEMCNIELSNDTLDDKWKQFSRQVLKALDPMQSFIERVELFDKGNSETKAQEEKKIDQMMEIQEGLTRDFIHIMKLISDYCIDVLGDPPCAFAQAGMGSLARKEVTPYSDFENMILLQDGVETRPDFPQIQEYFRWYSVIFQIILINFGETVLPSLAIPSLNDFHKDGENWFFDAYTGNGISFDGLMPHACKSPLGWQYGTPDNPGTPKELIQPVSKMVGFVDCSETKDDFHLSDMLLCTCFVAGMPHVYERYLELIKTQLMEDKVDGGLKEQLHHTMAQDIHKFNGLKGVTDMLLSMKWNVKKTIYRATTIFISSLGREKRAHSSSSFEILSELLDKGIIEPHFAHKLKYAVALACEIRLRIYLKKNRQEDWIDSEELPSCDLAMLVELIGVRNTYEYFSIVIFLHMCIESVLEHGKVVLPYSEKGLLFCLPHLLEYIVYCTEVTFEFGSRLMLATGNDLLNDFVNYKLIDMDKIFKALEAKTDPEIIKVAIESLSSFSSFLAVRGLFKEAMLCGMIEMHFQLSLQRGKSLNLARWSRSLTSNVFKNLSSYHKWDTLHLIDKFGKPKDGQK